MLFSANCKHSRAFRVPCVHIRERADHSFPDKKWNFERAERAQSCASGPFIIPIVVHELDKISQLLERYRQRSTCLKYKCTTSFRIEMQRLTYCSTVLQVLYQPVVSLSYHYEKRFNTSTFNHKNISNSTNSKIDKFARRSERVERRQQQTFFEPAEKSVHSFFGRSK